MIEYIFKKHNHSLDEFLPIETIREHLNLPFDEDDDYLILLRDNSIATAEKYMNRPIISQEVVYRVPDSNGKLPYYAKEILAVSDSTGKTIDEYHLDEDFGYYSINSNAVYPLNIKANCYFNSEPSGDTRLRIPVLMMIATHYENRESVSNGISVSEVPFNHERLLGIYRVPAGGS